MRTKIYVCGEGDAWASAKLQGRSGVTIDLKFPRLRSMTRATPCLASGLQESNVTSRVKQWRTQGGFYGSTPPPLKTNK